MAGYISLSPINVFELHYLSFPSLTKTPYTTTTMQYLFSCHSSFLARHRVAPGLVILEASRWAESSLSCSNDLPSGQVTSWSGPSCAGPWVTCVLCNYLPGIWWVETGWVSQLVSFLACSQLAMLYNSWILLLRELSHACRLHSQVGRGSR